LSNASYLNPSVSTALLLAAGTGSRLYPLTKEMPKCLTEVNQVSILARLVRSLSGKGFKRLVIVTGHLAHCIREYLGGHAGSMTIDYVHSPQYKTTNNIYSLWMARHVIHEPFMLIESDLIFEAALLDEMVYPDKIAVASMKPWMNGTTVSLNSANQVASFHKGELYCSDTNRYKTVNIYSFSATSWQRVKDRLDHYICAGKVHDYYESVFTGMVADGTLCFDAVSFDSKVWYEIDTLEDLKSAELLFPARKYIASKPYKEIPHFKRSHQNAMS